MVAEFAELKEKILKLLEEDREFRYAVAGLIGLGEILRRLDRHEEQLVKIWERLAKIDEEIAKIWGEIAKLREDMNRGFERHDKEFEKVWNEIARLREEMAKGFERHDAELAKLREDLVKGFERYDQLIAKLREDMIKGFERYDQQIAKLREDFNRAIQAFEKRFEAIDRRFEAVERRLDRHEEEIKRLREDMRRGFERVERRIVALGARWGVESEEAFREGLRGILEEELGLKVERWKTYDDKGVVFGYPSEVEVDVAVVDGKVIIIEISSHVRPSDVYTFKRKAELYKEKTGREPDRLIIVTPFAEEKALEAAAKLGIEIYTDV